MTILEMTKDFGQQWNGYIDGSVPDTERRSESEHEGSRSPTTAVGGGGAATDEPDYVAAADDAGRLQAKRPNEYDNAPFE